MNEGAASHSLEDEVPPRHWSLTTVEDFHAT